MTETTAEYVGDFAHLLKLRATLGKEQDRLEAEKTKAGTNIKDEIVKLRERLESIHKPFAELEESLFGKIDQVVEQLRTNWKDNPKTQYVEGYIVRRRDMKRIEVKDKDALVEELHKLGKLTASISKFDEKYLVKLAEVDILSKETAEITLKHNISCSLDKNAKQEKKYEADPADGDPEVGPIPPIEQQPEQAPTKAYVGMIAPEKQPETEAARSTALETEQAVPEEPRAD